MPADIINHWPSGARDTTEFPKVNIAVEVTFRDHLKAFTKMDGAGWTDYDAMNEASGSEMTGSRLRTYRKLYEKCGLIFRADGKIQLSRLGRQMAALEEDLETRKEEVPCKDSDGKDAITYAYVPGPFMRTYVKALQNSRTDAPKPFLLVIEEINRANVAAVFGDVFQLLDRGDDEVSEYPIQASEDIKKYLAEELGGNPNDYSEIRIPDNMFIWATMNSADQGVFPMDTAFKRRWDFTYLGIDDSEAGIVGKKVILGQGDYRRVVEWNALRKAINNELLTYKVNEDKLMGPYFISKKNLPEGEMIDPTVFARIFKNKVIMYLFDDAAKQKRITLFGGCDEKSKNQYSKICREFDTKLV